MVKVTRTKLPVGLLAHWKRVVLVIVALLIIGGAVYYFAFVQLYKSDYAHMLTSVNRVTTTYNDLLSARDDAVDKLGQSDEEFSKAVSSYRQKYTNYSEQSGSLVGERANRDSAVQAAYQSLREHNDGFGRFVATQFDRLPLVHSVVLDCSEDAPSKLNTSDLAKIVEVYDGAMKSCTEAMKHLADSNDAVVKKRGSDNVTYFDAMRTHVVAMQTAYTASDRSTFESEYNALLEALAQYEAHIQVRDLLDIDKNTVPATQLNALATLLSQHQR